MKRFMGIALAVLLFAGCTAGGPGDVQSSSVAVVPGGAVGQDSPYAKLVQIMPSAKCSVEGKLEGKFNQSQMSAYLQCVVPRVDEWLASMVSNKPRPQYYLVPRGVMVDVDSRCALTDEVLYYCAPVHRVFVGEGALWGQYENFGGATGAAIIAHGVGHHLQASLGVFEGTMTDQLHEELQANCVVGAFMAWATEKRLPIAGNENDAYNALAKTSETESPGGAGGTKTKHQEAFLRSFQDVGGFRKQGQPLLNNCLVYGPLF